MRRYFFLALGVIGLAGCGGGGGGSASTPPPAEAPPEWGTAQFSVDLKKGVATAVPLANPGDGRRAVYAGTAVSFSTTDVFSDAGELTRKRVLLRMRNNTGETIGANGRLRAMIGSLAPDNSPSVDFRSLTTVSTAAGDGNVGTSEGPAESTSIGAPSGAAFAGDNGLVVTANGRIRLVRQGYVSTLRASQLDPQGIVYLRSPLTGQEYAVYCETGNHVLRSINLGTASLVTFAGAVGTAGDAVGAPTSARFNQPSGIAIESQNSGGGALLVTDRANGKVKRIPFTWAGGGPVASAVESKYASINAPNGITVSDNGWIAVAESGTARVRVYPGGGSNAVILGGGGGSLPGFGNSVNLQQTYGVAYYGEQLVLTSGSEMAVAFLRTGASPILAQNWYVGQLAFSTPGFVDGAGTAALASSDLRHLSVDPGGRIALADAGNNRVREVDSNRAFLEIGQVDNDPTPPGIVELTNASGFSPTFQFGIRVPFVDFPSTVAPGETVDLGYLDFTVTQGISKFKFILSLETEASSVASLDAVLNSGTPLQGSSNVFVRTIAANSSAAVDGSLGVATVLNIDDIEAPADGAVYFFDSGRALRRYDPEKRTITTIAGALSASATTLDGIGLAARFVNVEAIAASADGELILASQTNHVIRAIGYIGPEGGDKNDPSNWRVATVLGHIGASGDANGIGSTARFNFPQALATLPGDKVFVVGQRNSTLGRIEIVGSDLFSPDSYSYVRTVFLPDTTEVLAISIGAGGRTAFVCLNASADEYVRSANHPFIPSAAITSIGTTSTDGLAATGIAANANSAAVDAAGMVYIGDVGRIRRYDSLGLRTVLGDIGTFGADGTGDTVRSSAISAMAVSPKGDLFVASSGRLFMVQRVVK